MGKVGVASRWDSSQPGKRAGHRTANPAEEGEADGGEMGEGGAQVPEGPSGLTPTLHPTCFLPFPPFLPPAASRIASPFSWTNSSTFGKYRHGVPVLSECKIFKRVINSNATEESTKRRSF